MIQAQEMIEIADHVSLSLENVMNVYAGGGSRRSRERVRTSAEILGIEPPGSPRPPEHTEELNFDED